MKTKSYSRQIVPAIALVIVLFLNACAPGARAATFRELANSVEMRPNVDEASAWTPVHLGDTIAQGGQVRTGAEASTRLDLTEGTKIHVGPNTVFTVEELKPPSAEPYTRLNVLTGEVWVALNGGLMEIQTGTAVAHVRGSYLYVSIITNSCGINTAGSCDGNGMIVTLQCLEGDCGFIFPGYPDLNLTNGNTALIYLDGNLPPNITPGIMTTEDIANFLLNSPEATVVVPTTYAGVTSAAATATSAAATAAHVTPSPVPTATNARGVRATFTPTTTNTPIITPSSTMPTCNENEVLQDGKCSVCAYGKANPETNQCEMMSCGGNKVYINGVCQLCPAGQEASGGACQQNNSGDGGGDGGGGGNGCAQNQCP